ncbi:hypothetical protein NFI96_003896 [Prochilodus magdalenae]|nr:hypothetical protein NFI96_003896 [Prochilodus magdalenae]
MPDFEDRGDTKPHHGHVCTQANKETQIFRCVPMSTGYAANLGPAVRNFSPFWFSVEPSDTLAVRGSPALLNCSVNSDTPAKVRWKKDGTFLSLATDDRRQVLSDGSLLINSVMHSKHNKPDEGTYQCVATIDSLGMIISRTARLSVAGKEILNVHSRYSFDDSYTVHLQYVCVSQYVKTPGTHKRTGLLKHVQENTEGSCSTVPVLVSELVVVGKSQAQFSACSKQALLFRRVGGVVDSERPASKDSRPQLSFPLSQKRTEAGGKSRPLSPRVPPGSAQRPRGLPQSATF